MASKTVDLNTTSYTQLDTGADTAIYAVNVGVVGVRIILKATEPGVGDEGWVFLRPGEALPRDGGAGLMWGLQKGALIGETAKVTVIE